MESYMMMMILQMAKDRRHHHQASTTSSLSSSHLAIAATYQPGWWWCLWRHAGQGTGSYCWLHWQPVSQSCRGCEPTGCWWTPWSQSDPAAEGRSPHCRRSGSRSAGRPGTSCTLCCRRHHRGRLSPWENATPGSRRFRSQWRSHSSGWMGHL